MILRPLLLVLLAAAAGCQALRPVADTTRHHAFPSAPSPAPAATAARVGVLPPDIAGHLRVRTLALRGPEGALGYLRDERWAEPLDTAFARLLVAELRQDPLLDAVALPERLGERMDTLLAVELVALEGDGDRIRAAARWRLADRDGNLLAADAVELTGPRSGATDRLGADLTAAAVELARRIRLGVATGLALGD